MSRRQPPNWLTARPIAHRGLHDRARGIIENTATAAGAACDRGFAIECDVQLSADGEAMVFHDFSLERLTIGRGRVDALSARELAALSFRDAADTMIALPDFLTLIADRAPLICEIKSRFDGDTRLAQRAAEIAAKASGRIALKSFDPALIAFLKDNATQLGCAHVPLGIVAMADFDGDEAEAALTPDLRRTLAHFLHWERTQPDFISYCIDDLPHAAPYLCRRALGVPVMTWTVRSKEQAEKARLWADQIVFEGDAPLS